jgi:hypothetical protein
VTKHSGLPQLIEAVIRDLETARLQFDADEGASGRLGVLAALDVIYRYNTILIGDRAPELLAPIRSVQHALHDAERGKLHALFNPKKHVGRPPDRTEHLGLAGWAAVLMQLLMDTGRLKSEAARQVARKLNSIGYRTPQGATISAKLVDEWRDRAKTELPAEDIVADRFARVLPETQSLFPGNPKAAFEHILQNLPSNRPVRRSRPEKSD